MKALYDDWVDAVKSLNKKQNAGPRLFSQYAGQIQLISSFFAQPPQSLNLLEFGMGWGFWSRMAQASGYQVSGLELASDRAAHARLMGLEVLEQLPEPGPHFHFVYANQVFEHLTDPLDTLRQLRHCLTSDGVIYLRVPDGRSVAKQLKTSGWSPELDAIHPLEHINCFTRNSLRELGSRAGLRLVQAPVRLSWGSLWGGVKREISDRYFTTHMFFKIDRKGG